MPRLSLLLPPAARFAGTALPAGLGRALGRADRALHAAGRQAQLSRHFTPLPDRWSDAALTRAMDAGEADARGSAWLRADPAHIRADINGARLLGIGGTLGIEQADVDAFLPALRPLFGDAGFSLDAPHPTRWYLRLPGDAKLPAFASPDDALGDDVFEHVMPHPGRDGPEARRWRVLASEAQVTLHNHPRNAERIAMGRPAINSLWFWGAGVLPDGFASRSPTLYSDDLLLHGIARIGKLDAMPLAACPHPAIDDALLDLRDVRDPRALADRWLSPALRSAASGEVLLDFADGSVFTLRRNQRWRVWRKPFALQP